jgi:hypothetical protein
MIILTSASVLREKEQEDNWFVFSKGTDERHL